MPATTLLPAEPGHSANWHLLQHPALISSKKLAYMSIYRTRTDKKRPVVVLGETRPANPEKKGCGGSSGLVYFRSDSMTHSGLPEYRFASVRRLRWVGASPQSGSQHP